MKTRFAKIGVEPMSMTPVEFGQFIADETKKWAKVCHSAWGPDADRHAKLLIHFISEGSHFRAYSQVVPP